MSNKRFQKVSLFLNRIRDPRIREKVKEKLKEAGKDISEEAFNELINHIAGN